MTMAATTPTPRPWIRFALIGIVAFLYGRVTAEIPAPHDPETFWLGNLGAPYLLIPFLAGAWRFGVVGAATAGGIAGAGLIAGFYDLLGVADNSNISMGLPLATPDLERMVHGYVNWFGTFLIAEPVGFPWLTIAIVLGAGCGLLGFWWNARGSRVAGALIALPFLVEPIVYLFGLNTRIFPAAPYAWYPGNVLIWAAELVVGLVLLWWLVVRARPGFVDAIPGPGLQS
jgi:hypothetical protein